VSGTDVVFDAVSNCLELPASVAAPLSIPAGLYTVSVSGNADYGSGTAPFKGVVVSYLASGGEMTELFEPGTTAIVEVIDGAPNVYGYLLDWAELGDNIGQYDVTFTPLCHDRLGDYNCDGFEDAVDLALLIDRVFFGGGPATTPCPQAGL